MFPEQQFSTYHARVMLDSRGDPTEVTRAARIVKEIEAVCQTDFISQAGLFSFCAISNEIVLHTLPFNSSSMCTRAAESGHEKEKNGEKAQL